LVRAERAVSDPEKKDEHNIKKVKPIKWDTMLKRLMM